MKDMPPLSSSSASSYFDAPLEPTIHRDSATPGLSNTSAGAADVNEQDYVVHRPQSSSGWLPATDIPPDSKVNRANRTLPSQDTASASANVQRSASRRSLFTNQEGRPIDGSTFIAGAATTGPNSVAQPDEELTTRAAAAEASLTPRQKSRIAKSEGEYH